MIAIARKRNVLFGMAAFMLLMAVVLPVKSIDDNLLLYLTFDNDTAGVTADVTGKTKGGKLRRRYKGNFVGRSREGIGTQRHQRFCRNRTD